jgi:peroxiredoxin
MNIFRLPTTVFFAFFVFQSSAQALPKLTLKTTEGKTVCTDTLNNAGKPMIISFFALWCKPCLRELEAISEVYDEWQEETGVKLVAVSIDKAQDASKILPAIRGKGWTYEVLLDQNSEFMRAMNVNAIPAVFVLDGNGKIVFRKNSYIEGSENELIEKIREII